jgi:hypothetical protein
VKNKEYWREDSDGERSDAKMLIVCQRASEKEERTEMQNLQLSVDYIIKYQMNNSFMCNASRQTCEILDCLITIIPQRLAVHWTEKPEFVTITHNAAFLPKLFTFSH